MAFDLSALLNDPMFQFGASVFGHADPSWQPLAKALQMYQNQSRLTTEQDQRAEELKMRKDQATAAAQARKAEAERVEQVRKAQAKAVRASLANELQLPADIPRTVPIGGDRPGPYLPAEPGLPGGAWDMPTAYESDKMRVFGAINDMAEMDPEGALGMAQSIYKGDIPVAGMPGKPQRAPVLRDFQMPGGEQQTRQWDETNGAWNPIGPPVPRWKPDRPRATGGGSTGAGAGTPPKKLTAEMERTRQEIQNARAAVTRIAKTGTDPRVFAAQNPGFKATLEKANKRMPGGDDVWESYMEGQARKLKAEEAARKVNRDAIRKQMGM